MQRLFIACQCVIIIESIHLYLLQIQFIAGEHSFVIDIFGQLFSYISLIDQKQYILIVD